MISRGSVYRAIRDWLESGTTKQVGMMVIPEEPVLPYTILYPLTGIPGPGSMAGNDELDYMYQITCVGRDDRECGWMSSKVFTVHEDRLGFPLLIAGQAPVWRLPNEVGAMLPSGDKLYACNDTYTLRMGV